MASDTRKITIEIIGENSGGGSKEGTNKKETKKTTKKIKEEIVKTKVYEKVARQVWDNAINIAEFQMNRYFTLSEDYISQNTYNNVKRSINKANQIWGTAKSIAFMAASGNVVGAGIAAASSIINEGMEYYQKISSHYQALNATNYQTGFSATRAGLVNDSRGTEN